MKSWFFIILNFIIWIELLERDIFTYIVDFWIFVKWWLAALFNKARFGYFLLTTRFAKIIIWSNIECYIYLNHIVKKYVSIYPMFVITLPQ